MGPFSRVVPRFGVRVACYRFVIRGQCLVVRPDSLCQDQAAKGQDSFALKAVPITALGKRPRLRRSLKGFAKMLRADSSESSACNFEALNGVVAHYLSPRPRLRRSHVRNRTPSLGRVPRVVKSSRGPAGGLGVRRESTPWAPKTTTSASAPTGLLKASILDALPRRPRREKRESGESSVVGFAFQF